MKTNTKHWPSIAAGILSLTGYVSAASLGSEKYTYDASGNIIEKSVDGKVTQMTYAPSNRLTERQTIGQTKEATAYDAAGRPIVLNDEIGQTTRSMIYGYGDKVLEVKTHKQEVDLFYNAEGQLVGRKIAGRASTFSWDNNVLAAEDNTAFTNESHITGGVPLLESGRDIVVSDYLGNTLSNGDCKVYGTAYGNGLEGNRFTGKPFIKELNGYVFQNRIYSPETGRWFEADPSGFPDGSNNLCYVQGDPVNKVDPLGLTVWPTPANGSIYNHTDQCSGPGEKVHFTADGFEITYSPPGVPSTTFRVYSIASMLGWAQTQTVSIGGTGMDPHVIDPGQTNYTIDVSDADEFTGFDAGSSRTPAFACGGNTITPMPYHIAQSRWDPTQNILSVYEK
jgi:RHS repeat-associated protein